MRKLLLLVVSSFLISIGDVYSNTNYPLYPDFELAAKKRKKTKKRSSSSKGNKNAGSEFKLDFAAGAAIGKAPGIVFATEPKYEVIDNLHIGIRLEEGLMFSFPDISVNSNSQYSNVYTSSSDASILGVFSTMPTAEYTFYGGGSNFRLFGGAGAGLFFVFGGESNNMSEDDAETKMDIGMKFGFAPRVGMEFKRFRVAIEYNIVLTENINANHLTIKLGFFAWGKP